MNKNPWLDISYEDYIGHMDSPEVDQYKMINKVFKESLEDFSPKSIFVPGCTIGNGFEHIDWSSVKSVTALDINANYLDVVRQKYGHHPQLKIINADLQYWDSDSIKFDMIYAALVFEYVNVSTVLKMFYKSMHSRSRLITILQNESALQSKVSQTEYTSLEKLNSIMHLVNISDFEKILHQYGFEINDKKIITLNSGKIFSVYELVTN